MRNLTSHPLLIFPPNAPSRVRVEGGRFFDPETGEEIFPTVVIPPDPEGPLRLKKVVKEEVAVQIGDVVVPVDVCFYVAPALPPPGEAVIVSLSVAYAWAWEYEWGCEKGYIGLYPWQLVSEEIYTPDTDDGAVKDEEGNIVGIRRLIQIRL
jgi:hypothetical protein